MKPIKLQGFDEHGVQKPTRSWVVCWTRTIATKNVRDSKDHWDVFKSYDEANKKYKQLYYRDDIYVRSLCAVIDSSDYEPHPLFRVTDVTDVTDVTELSRSWIVCTFRRNYAHEHTSRHYHEWEVCENSMDAIALYSYNQDDPSVLVNTICAVIDSSDYEPHPAFSKPKQMTEAEYQAAVNS